MNREPLGPELLTICFLTRSDLSLIVPNCWRY